MASSKNRKKTGRKPGTFTPGDPRINKKGRPPLSERELVFRDLCRDKSEAALERLERLGRRGAPYAVKANSVIIEHAWGKLVKLEHTGKDGGPIEVESAPPDDFSALSIEELRLYRQLERKRLAARKKADG